jgi:hypothetical protein
VLEPVVAKNATKKPKIQNTIKATDAAVVAPVVADEVVEEALVADAVVEAPVVEAAAVEAEVTPVVEETTEAGSADAATAE